MGYHAMVNAGTSRMACAEIGLFRCTAFVEDNNPPELLAELEMSRSVAAAGRQDYFATIGHFQEARWQAPEF